MMNDFARLFETEEHGQVLVVIYRDGDGDEKPKINMMFNFQEVSLTLSFGFNTLVAAESFFSNIDQAWAVDRVNTVKQKMAFELGVGEEEK